MAFQRGKGTREVCGWGSVSSPRAGRAASWTRSWAPCQGRVGCAHHREGHVLFSPGGNWDGRLSLAASEALLVTEFGAHCRGAGCRQSLGAVPSASAHVAVVSEGSCSCTLSSGTGVWGGSAPGRASQGGSSGSGTSAVRGQRLCCMEQGLGLQSPALLPTLPPGAVGSPGHIVRPLCSVSLPVQWAQTDLPHGRGEAASSLVVRGSQILG